MKASILCLSVAEVKSHQALAAYGKLPGKLSAVQRHTFLHTLEVLSLRTVAYTLLTSLHVLMQQSVSERDASVSSAM